MRRFRMGTLEVSPSAQAALERYGLCANLFFDRHARGDWGEKEGQADEAIHRENEWAATQDACLPPIRSRYRLPDGTSVLVFTAMDRSRTRLLLATEYEVREVSALEGYAAWAGLYDAVRNPLIEAEQPSVDALLARLAPFRTAVDVGTGTGRHALQLARMGAQVTGFDASPEMLSVARERAQAEALTTVRFVPAALGDTPLPATSASVDLVLCALTLCHLPDLRKAVAECARLLRPGGHLILTDFHPAAVAFGWRTAFPTPATNYLLPNMPHSRVAYLDAVQAAGCTLIESSDLSLDGKPYGDLSEEAIRARGEPPFCLILLAQTK